MYSYRSALMSFSVIDISFSSASLRFSLAIFSRFWTWRDLISRSSCLIASISFSSPVIFSARRSTASSLLSSSFSRSKIRLSCSSSLSRRRFSSSLVSACIFKACSFASSICSFDLTLADSRIFAASSFPVWLCLLFITTLLPYPSAPAPKTAAIKIITGISHLTLL